MDCDQDLPYSVARAPADIAVGAKLIPIGGGNWEHLKSILAIVRPDIAFVEDTATVDATLLFCGASWRVDLDYARARGLTQAALIFPLGGSYHEFFLTPLTLVSTGDAERPQMSLSGLENFMEEMGTFFGHRAGDRYIPEMSRYAPARHISGPHPEKRHCEILNMLADAESRKDFDAVFSAEPIDLWRHWARDLYNGLQYTDYVRIAPDHVVLNCGVHGGQELPFYLAKLGGRGICVNVDPLGHEYLTPDVQKTIRQSPTSVIEVAAALHDGDGTVDLPVEVGGMAAGNRIGLQLAGAPLRTFRAVKLDTIVAELSLRRLDCIKMDIEGAEERALKGGIETINRFRPNLAISIYHTPDQFLDIPLYLARNLNKYRFFVRSYHFISNETILYAIPEERPFTKRTRSIEVRLS